MYKRIYSVDLIDLSLLRSAPSILLATACGRVASSSWSNIVLSPHVYVMPPSDGVLDCDMIGSPPNHDQIVLPVLSPACAELILDDVENYWGGGIPLRGVRIHASANTKTVLLEERPEGMPEIRLISHKAGSTAREPSFEADIKPLFRVRDVAVMKANSGFDLHVYDDVVSDADGILNRLVDGTMPCDGAWPEADIALFRRWIDANKPA